jgi:hypothetical protein
VKGNDMAVNLIETLNMALEATEENKKEFIFAIEQLEKRPEMVKPLTKLLSTISDDYLIRVIEVIVKSQQALKDK